jgi:hypothetical protein
VQEYEQRTRREFLEHDKLSIPAQGCRTLASEPDRTGMRLLTGGELTFPFVVVAEVHI